MIRALLAGFRHYADFSGLTPRKEFWEFIVGTHLILICLLIPAWLLFLQLYEALLYDTAVLNAIEGILLAPDEAGDIICNDLAQAAYAVWQTFAETLVADHLPSLICTGLAGLWGLGIIIPTLAITARRLQDADYSRWWIAPLVLVFIPLPIIADLGLLGSFAVLILCCMPTSPKHHLPAVPTA